MIVTGIGGQGVQLAAQVLARAAVAEGRHVMMLGTTGGTMRGGNTDAMLVVGDDPIGAPPIVSHAWSALVAHPQFFPPLRARLRPDAVVLVNASLAEGDLGCGGRRVFALPATGLAVEVGNAMAVSMVMVGAFARLTGLVALASLVDCMRESLPPYRRQHAELNERALGVGFEAAPEGVAPAWREAA